MTGMVVTFVTVGFVCFCARFGQKFRNFTVAALHVDRFSIILQSSLRCTVRKVDKPRCLVNGEGFWFQRKVCGAAAFIGGSTAVARKTHKGKKIETNVTTRLAKRRKKRKSSGEVGKNACFLLGLAVLLRVS